MVVLDHFNTELLLLLSRFSRVRLCATPQMAAHQACLSLRFSRQEHRSGLPFPSTMYESESEVAQSCLTLHDPMDCSLPGFSIHGSFQARVLEWDAIAFSYTEKKSLFFWLYLFMNSQKRGYIWFNKYLGNGMEHIALNLLCKFKSSSYSAQHLLFHHLLYHLIISYLIFWLLGTSWATLGWKKHKLESRLPGEISITSDTQMTPPLWQKVKRNSKASW